MKTHPSLPDLPSPATFVAGVLLVLSAMTVPSARAQPAAPQAPWIWINSSGIKTFSDVAPPAGTPDKKILSRPGQYANTAAASASAAASAPRAAAPSAAASVPRASGKDPEIEKRIKAEEAAKKAAEDAAAKAEEAKADAAIKAACARAQRVATGLSAGGRVATVNAKGEREFLTDEQRAESLRKAQNNIVECNKAP